MIDHLADELPKLHQYANRSTNLPVGEVIQQARLVLTSEDRCTMICAVDGVYGQSLADRRQPGRRAGSWSSAVTPASLQGQAKNLLAAAAHRGKRIFRPLPP
jgi:hypothetical protein